MESMKYAINLLKIYGFKPLYDGIFIKISPLILLIGILDLAPENIYNSLMDFISKVKQNKIKKINIWWQVY